MSEGCTVIAIMGRNRDNGKENGSYRDYRVYDGAHFYIVGLHWDNGKENGNYYIIIGVI